MAIDFVKFQRGTPQDYAQLVSRSKVESNALYFIYEAGASSGLLYLGEILIGGIGSESAISNLAQLEDVALEALGAADLLMYSEVDQVWKNVSIQEIANLIAAEQSLGFQLDANIFEWEEELNSVPKLKLLGFDAASEGSSLIKVNGKVAWSENTIDSINTKVTNLEETIESIRTAISNIDHLKYQVIDSIDEAIEENVVYLLKVDENSGDDKYDEYMFVNGTLERLGDWGVNLDGYATTEQLNTVKSDLTTLLNNSLGNYVEKTVFNTQVGDITKLITYDAESPKSIIEELNSIYERLTWASITV